MLPTQLPKLRIALTSSSRLLSSPSPSRHFTSSSSSSKLKSKPKPSSHSSTTTEDAAEGPERPQISYLTLSTLYPFLLLSIMTSLALNLSHNRSKFKDEELTSRARISILERIILRLQQNDRLISEGKGKGKAVGGGLSEEEQEIIERELELVGLGRGKGKKVMKADGTITTTGDEEVGTSWREVFLGKKGKEWEEPDEVDWEKGKITFLLLRFLVEKGETDTDSFTIEFDSLQRCR